MKLVALVTVCVAALVSDPNAGADEPKREPKPRFKGVEAYSWKDDKGVWQFALLDGTNNEKTENLVKSAPTVYAGVDKFIGALSLLAEGEQVFWGHRIKGFEYPLNDDLKKIDKAAEAAKIRLNRER
ncbi:hypothetical protein [Frigoriglobus tundricola]|uniref:Uncharacterized protein n=1 Tax=Frigoriglobus tundricola TaxID=2774151 RepID=A0A6M5YK36_9BACT|nr:hypothetical protein [Frigoriglobus tundricola]QJW94419.1 hypothetical protein FTUN_1939 [Frigoriglobus tundricola]